MSTTRLPARQESNDACPSARVVRRTETRPASTLLKLLRDGRATVGAQNQAFAVIRAKRELK